MLASGWYYTRADIQEICGDAKEQAEDRLHEP